MQEQLLPHFNERESAIDMLVLHATAHENTQEVVDSLDKLKLSCHYIMDMDGNLTRCVAEEKRAWHAGEGNWRGITDLNSHSIGIEICNMSLGQEVFTEKQIAKLIPFCKKLINKYKIPAHNIVGHSDIAPTRKPDPGIRFPWKMLAREDVGLWYQPRNAFKMMESDVAVLLAQIGYDTHDEETTIASSYAFRRHFLPEEVAVDEDVKHLVDNVYPKGDKSLLDGDKFMQTLKAVAFTYMK